MNAAECPVTLPPVDFVLSLLQWWIVDKLTRSPNFQAALTGLAHRIVTQPDWDEERPRSITAAGEAPA